MVADGPTLACLQIPSLSILFIVATAAVASPRLLHCAGVPHVAFPAYSRDEMLDIVGRDPPAGFDGQQGSDGRDESEGQEGGVRADAAWVWPRFCAVVWDSLGRGAARDLVSFRAACEKLWWPFVQPVVDGQLGPREFSRLLVNRRHLFQSDEALVEKIVARPAASGSTRAGARGTSQPQTHQRQWNIYIYTYTNPPPQTATHDLPLHAAHLLIAAYLASYNPPRADSALFTHAAESRRRRRNTRKQPTNPSTPSKAAHRKPPRHLLAPSPFPLDRLLAIAHAVAPRPLPQTADVPAQIATLVSLRLLLRSGGAGAAGDGLDAGARWRVNVGWDVVCALGRRVGVEVGDFVGWSLGG